jgi:hypothetical protein
MIENRARLNAVQLLHVARAVDRLVTLEEVVRWGHSQRPRRLVEDVVAQDEFSYDVVMQYCDGVYLVFATSCLGAVEAVAAWDHRPFERELLDARLLRGWRPTPTDTRAGPRVLGYAAHFTGEPEAASAA